MNGLVTIVRWLSRRQGTWGELALLGLLAVSRLAHTLEAEQIQGRLILIPAVNIPAALNATRLSPIDGRDLNRCFPGNPKGTFSEMLAHFIDSKVLPHVDASVDLHTAGHELLQCGGCA